MVSKCGKPKMCKRSNELDVFYVITTTTATTTTTTTTKLKRQGVMEATDYKRTGTMIYKLN